MARAEQQSVTSERREHSRIPIFESIEEEAEFWDTHSITEFEDEWEPVTDIVIMPGGPTKRLSVRLDERTFRLLREEAKREGVAMSRLARWWLVQRTRRPSGRPE